MARAVTLYGIPNCDQARRARAWLDEQRVAYRFHDFKREGLSAPLAERWIGHAGTEKLVNRRGTTWRGLSEAQKAVADSPATAGPLLCAHPSVVKRPVLDVDGGISVGFDPGDYARLFK